MSHPTRSLVVAAAVAANGVVGIRNGLPWRLGSDLRRFRTLTLGSTLLMGRRTFESIGSPLPRRRTVVLTRNARFAADGVETVHRWEDAVAACDDHDFVVGGPEIYALALPLAAAIHLTEVDAQPPGDAWMPPFDRRAFAEVRRERHPAGDVDDHSFTFLDLIRRS